MKGFSRLGLAQKGALAGVFFAVFVGILYTIVLIIFDLIFQSKGIPHQCYMFTHTEACSFSEAIFSRLGFFAVFVMVFGIPLAIVGGIVGYLIDKIKIG